MVGGDIVGGNCGEGHTVWREFTWFVAVSLPPRTRWMEAVLHCSLWVRRAESGGTALIVIGRVGRYRIFGMVTSERNGRI